MDGQTPSTSVLGVQSKTAVRFASPTFLSTLEIAHVSIQNRDKNPILKRSRAGGEAYRRSLQINNLFITVYFINVSAHLVTATYK